MKGESAACTRAQNSADNSDCAKVVFTAVGDAFEKAISKLEEFQQANKPIDSHPASNG